MKYLLLVSLLLQPACNSGPRTAYAGRLSESNFEREHVGGPASQGLAGDFYLRNDVVRAVVQAPGRAMGPCPWGGNVIDLDLVANPAGDQLGEISPFLALGRTVNFTDVHVDKDGSDGGAAVIVARGEDAIDDFINIYGLGGFTVAALSESLRPTIPLKLEVTATYTLAPGDSFIRVDYAIHNLDGNAKKVLFGTLTDTGAEIELFHPGVGYGEFTMNQLLLGSVPTVEYVALQGRGVTYGIVPVERDPQAKGAPLPIGGVVVEAYEQRSFSDALGPAGQTVAIGGNGTATRSVWIAALPGGAGAVEGFVRAQKGQAHAPVRGQVSGTTSAAAGGGARAQGDGARVAVSRAGVADAGAALVTTFVADADGVFAGELPPGDYVAEAEGDAWRRSPPVTFHVAATTGAPSVALTLPDRAELSYRVHDAAGATLPSKVTVVGAVANPQDRRFRDVVKDPMPYGVAAWLASRAGDSTLDNEFDHRIALAPGHYRVVVSHGPEWSNWQKELDVPAEGASIDATLVRVVDTTGYVAADFHQHSHKSPDSPVSPEERLVANLADGVEYLSSSEHDLLFDYRPIIDALGAGALIDSGVGVESTPFDYGHFIGYPLRIDATMPNGGALDWGNGGLGDLAPAQIFDGLRAQGAQVVQVNHPRTPPLNISYQQNFDRGGLRFDFARYTFFSDAALLEVSARDLGLPDNAALFAPGFNAHEVYLGFWPDRDVTLADGERQDLLVNTNLRDFMNFVSFGYIVTAVGDSDTHQRWSVPSGIPRTMVRVPDDSAGAIAGGIGDDVVRTMAGQAPRDVVVTNGPMLALAVGPDRSAGGIGRTVTLPAGATQLAVHVEAQSAEWAPIDTIEVYANATFTVPPPSGTQPDPLLPILCFTARAVPSQRCTMAVGGARALVIAKELVGPVGAGAFRYKAVADASLVNADVLARTRAGGRGKDFWLLARVTGVTGLWPVIPQAVDPTVVPVADLVAGKPLVNQGVPALAFTNPVFVDVDGGGWRAPFAP
ncbi:MAG: hypothetical protein JWN44_1797 [Myxococcales bacterium]|nr:hypothetical protein [Myxococcales bacterium]